MLDINVVSELRKVALGKVSPEVVAWADRQDEDDLFVSAVTLLELEIGVRRMRCRDPLRGGALRVWLDSRVTTEFGSRILPVDTAVAQRCARLHVPDPRSEREALIAATALLHGMTAVTQSAADFAPTGVPLVNPREAGR